MTHLRVMGAHQRRIGHRVITDERYEEWQCPECGILAYIPVGSCETLACIGHESEFPVWMVKTTCNGSMTTASPSP